MVKFFQPENQNETEVLAISKEISQLAKYSQKKEPCNLLCIQL